jgi:hypothetical protein
LPGTSLMTHRGGPGHRRRKASPKIAAGTNRALRELTEQASHLGIPEPINQPMTKEPRKR